MGASASAQGSSPGVHPTLSDHISAVRERWWVVVLAVVVTTIVTTTAGWLVPRPIRTEARVLAVSGPVARALDATVLLSPATEAAIVTSAPVVDAVRERIGEPADVSVSVEGEGVLVVTAESSDATEAANTANAYATAYIAVRNRQIQEAIAASAADLRAAMSAAAAALGDRADELERVLDAVAGPREATTDDASLALEIARSPGDASAVVAALSLLAYRELADNLVAYRIAAEAGPELLEAADTPAQRSPLSPVLIVLGATAGVFLGVAVAISLGHWEAIQRG